MSDQFEAEVFDEDIHGNELDEPYCLLEDGRQVVEMDGVDHRETPTVLAKTILKLSKKVKRNQELVEIVLGDDAIWYAIVPKRKPRK